MTANEISKPRTLKPWFREPWPWLLMSGPAIVVVAGIVTAVLAVRTHDGLVADDYYKQGMSVNKDISRDLNAKAANIQADAVINPHAQRVVLSIQHIPEKIVTLDLVFARATVSGKDRRVALQRSGPTTFVGSLMPLEIGKWYATLDDDSHAWRLVSSVNVVESAATAHFKLGSGILAPADD